MTAYQGKPVLYTLSESDVIAIKADRDRTGARGNTPGVGDVCGAFIAKLWNPTYANLTVFLDGQDTYWATSKQLGTSAGCWYDPTDTAAVITAAPATSASGGTITLTPVDQPAAVDQAADGGAQ